MKTIFENLVGIAGFDNCVVGVSFTSENPPVLCYDWNKLCDMAQEVFGIENSKEAYELLVVTVTIVERMYGKKSPTFLITNLENQNSIPKLSLN
jgi:hypothetical protein